MLLLDLGNTRVKFALGDGDAIIRRGAVAWDDSAGFALASAWASWPRPDHIVAASVVDGLRESMVDEAAVAAFDRPLESKSGSCQMALSSTTKPVPTMRVNAILVLPLGRIEASG